jgi:hypothetical protein
LATKKFKIYLLILLFIGIYIYKNTYANPFSQKLTHTLAKQDLLHIPYEQALAIENKLGQLLYINIDGYSYSGEYAIDPLYFKLVKDLNIGGVLAHYNSADAAIIRKTNDKLQSLCQIPLFIGIDFVKLKLFEDANTDEEGNYWVLGNSTYEGGFLNQYRELGSEEFKLYTDLQAFIIRSLGINHILGPTIDNSVQCDDRVKRALAFIKFYQQNNLLVTIKHFPYLPLTSDLHKESPDTNLAPAVVEQHIIPFKQLASYTDFIMTTHIFNSQIDKNDIVTFSSLWNYLLKESLQYEGLIISDALFMITNYEPGQLQSFSAPFNHINFPWQKHKVSIFALRAILAGHDMIIIEGDAPDTEAIFRDLFYIACQDHETGELLRKRIEDSYARVYALKQEHWDLIK